MKRPVVIASTVLLTLVACSMQTSTPTVPATNLTAAKSVAPAAIALSATYAVGITGGAAISNFANGPDGRIWFTEFNANKIGAITTDGAVSEYATSGGSQPYSIARTPRKRSELWAGGYGGEIVKMTRTGSAAYFTVSGAHIGGIVYGPDKSLWFADYGNNKIGRVTRSGSIAEFAVPSGTQPTDLAVGKDGNLWITDDVGATIIRMKPTGIVIKSYSAGISAGDYPNEIVAAPDGNLYFTEYSSATGVHDTVARITTKGKIDEIAPLPLYSHPNGITIGKDGNVYFSFLDRKAVGKLVISTEKVKLTKLNLANDNGTSAIFSGPDGRLWLAGYQTIYALTY